ncbi:MAG: TlpA family protein disulfide reductase, partial [Duncaniella sp.]|nr:TlpA family protein disulfide reductase [Duncaniella sp.]
INGENISFTGDNVSISDFLSAYHTAYNYMTFKVKPDQIEAGYNFDNDKAKLDAGADKASNLLNAVPAEEREYYTALNQAGYDYTYLSILSSDHYLNGNNRTAEMNEITARINPDSDEARVSGLLSMWMRTDSAFNAKAMEYRDSVGPTVAQIWAIDASLNNQANKNSLYSSVASMFMFYNPSDEEIEKFFVLVKPQLDKAPAIEAQIREQIADSKKVVSDGDALPNDPTVISPDGTKHNLSSLFDGKIVYIDLWATWCGPCCREIPFLEKVVEQYKDNDNVKFISISCDQDKEAWLKKLEKDNPSWPQYIFDEKSGNQFMKAMHANGIPRFFLIGRDGKFILVKATRPSDSKMLEELNAALAAE